MGTRDEKAILKAGTSIADKIKAKARNTKQDAQFLLRKFATERLLVRLEQSRFSGEWCLKGGLLMLTLSGDLYRPTEDLDVTTMSEFDSKSLLAIIKEVTNSDPEVEDGLTFVVNEGSSHVSREGDANPGLRMVVDATLHTNTAPVKLTIKIDATHGEAISPHPVLRQFPQTHSAYEPPVLPAYPWETVVAEKIHGITRHGFFNTRIKDFYDLVAISRQVEFSGPALAHAVQATFERRKDPPVESNPIGLSADFAARKETDWAKFMRSSGVGGSVKTLTDAVVEIKAFLAPVLSAIVDGEKFDMAWRPGHGWHEAPGLTKAWEGTGEPKAEPAQAMHP